MSNIDDRLRAADPMAGRTYQHPNLDAMVSRITAPVNSRLNAQWRGFKVRMASAVGATALITVGGIAALQGAGPSLQVLALGATHAKANVPAASGMMRIYEKFSFTAGPDLSASPSLGAAYALQSPANPSAEAARLASVFNVSGTPQDVNGDGTDWNVTDSAGNTLDYEFYGGVANWYFNAATPSATSSVAPTPPATGTSSSSGSDPSGPVPSTATLEKDAQGYLQQLGYGYTLSDPSFSTSTTSTGPTSDPTLNTVNEETVDYTVSVDGTATDQTAQFTVDGSNNLINASGPSFNVASSTNYPLQSPVDGVAVLNADQQQQFGPVNGTTVIPVPSSGAVSPLGTSASTTTPGSPAGTSDSTTTTPPLSPPIVNVVLNDVTVSLGTYQLDDGTVYLVPVYSYDGVATSADGTTYTSTWSTIAVSPSYVHFSTARSGGVIAY